MTSIVVGSRTRGASDPDRSLPEQALYRALRMTADTFVREVQIDELAYSAGVDPVDYRLSLLQDERLATVMEAAARRFGWWFPWYPVGGPALWAKGWLRRGGGVAVGLEEDRRVATCAEVRPDGIARLRVTRIVTAYECGAVFDPDAVIAQIKGSTTMALSSALAGSLAFGRDQADSPSLPAGQMPGPADAPKIEVLLLDRPDLPSTGVGATPLIALAPAIANAIFAATGQRLRSLSRPPEGPIR